MVNNPINKTDRELSPTTTNNNNPPQHQQKRHNRGNKRK